MTPITNNELRLKTVFEALDGGRNRWLTDGKLLCCL
jgi:hypothetical protein